MPQGPTPTPQGPNPGPVPFQQANAGLASARQQGGPSPVASLVAATKPRQRRQAPQPAQTPRADFSGIDRAGAAIGNVMREKYQREWDEKQAETAHQYRKDETAERLKLEEESQRRTQIDTLNMNGINDHLRHQVTEARRNMEGFSRAAAARRNGGPALTEDWASFDMWRTASPDLFMQGATSFMRAEETVGEDTALIWQDWMNKLHDDAGMPRGLQIVDREAQDATTHDDAVNQQTVEADLVHGPNGRGYSPAHRVAVTMMAEMGNHSLISNQLLELQNMEDVQKQRNFIEGIADRVAKNYIHQSTRDAAITQDLFGQDMIKKVTHKDGPTTYTYDRVKHRPAMQIAVRDLVRANYSREGGFSRSAIGAAGIAMAGLTAGTSLALTAGAVGGLAGKGKGSLGDLEDDEIGSMISGLLGGPLAEMATTYLNMPADQRSLVRASMALKPGGQKQDGFNPHLARVLNSYLTNLDSVLVAITVMAPDPSALGNEGQFKSLKQKLESFYGYDNLDEEGVATLLGMTIEIRNRIKRGQAATSAQGGLDAALAQQGAALRMDADIHVKALMDAGMKGDEAILEHYNRNMSVFIGMPQEDFSRDIIELFNSLGSKTNDPTGQPTGQLTNEPGMQGGPPPQPEFDPNANATPQPQQNYQQ